MTRLDDHLAESCSWSGGTSRAHAMRTTGTADRMVSSYRFEPLTESASRGVRRIEPAEMVPFLAEMVAPVQLFRLARGSGRKLGLPMLPVRVSGSGQSWDEEGQKRHDVNGVPMLAQSRGIE